MHITDRSERLMMTDPDIAADQYCIMIQRLCSKLQFSAIVCALHQMI